MTYTRTATKEEIELLTEDERAELSAKAEGSPVLVDQMTYQPYMVIDEVRYNIEAIEAGESQGD